MNADQHINCYYPVLDHGFVALTNYMGDDQAIEQAARVSYGEGTRKKRKTRGLIRYLMRHHHTSPLEQVELQFHAAMPLFVARQWIRHRTAKTNEYSGRYSVMPGATYTPEEWRLQSKKNRQGSSDESVQEEKNKSLNLQQRFLNDSAWAGYCYRLDQDVSRELARIDLPLSSYTEWYWKIDLHNLFHFLNLRMDPHAQWEIRQYANVMAGLAAAVAPLATEAFFDYKLNAYSLSRAEVEALRDICAGGRVNEFELEDNGMSKREIREFKQRMTGEWAPPKVSDFLLDPKDALTPKQAHIRLHGEDQNNT